MIILGIDLGKARTGVAVCDRAEMLASPLCVIQEHNRERLIEKIVKLSNERRGKSLWACRKIWMAPKEKAPKTPGNLERFCKKRQACR